MRCIDEVENLPRVPWVGRGGADGEGVSNATLEANMLDGVELHPSITSAADRGYTAEQLTAIMMRSAAKDDPDPARRARWKECIERDIPRAVESAQRRRLKRAEEAFGEAVRPPSEGLQHFFVPPLPPNAVKLPILVPSDFSARPIRPREWIVKDGIPKGEPTLLYGPGSAGKSLLILQLAIACATGTPWLGRLVPKCRVLFFTCEDDTDEINRRAAKVLESLNLTWDHCGDRLAVIPMRETDTATVLAVESKDGTLVGTPTLEALRGAVGDFKPDIVIIDTLADAFAGNENDRTHAKEFVRLILTLNRKLTYIVTAHPSVSGAADGRGSSGSTGWPAAVRSHLYMERARAEKKDDIVDPDERFLSDRKGNYSQLGSFKIKLRWRNGVFEPTNDEVAEAFGEDEVDRLFLDLLGRFNRLKSNVSASPGPTYAPKLFADEAEAKARKVTDKMLKAAMLRLIGSGQVENVQHRGGKDARYHLEVVNGVGSSTELSP